LCIDHFFQRVRDEALVFLVGKLSQAGGKVEENPGRDLLHSAQALNQKDRFGTHDNVHRELELTPAT